MSRILEHIIAFSLMGVILVAAIWCLALAIEIYFEDPTQGTKDD